VWDWGQEPILADEAEQAAMGMLRGPSRDTSVREARSLVQGTWQPPLPPPIPPLTIFSSHARDSDDTSPPPRDSATQQAEMDSPRPRKKAFSHRSKTGCQTCRRRRKKCGEEKPACKNCVKSHFRCDFLDFRGGFLAPKPGVVNRD
jgi:hypothetical protein